MVAIGAYGDLGLREFVDLGHPGSPDEDATAHSMRWTTSDMPPGSMSRSVSGGISLRTGHDRKVIRDDRFVIEIQWALAERSYGIPRDPSPLFARARSIPIGGHEMPTLSVHDELLVLGLHGSFHLWERLALGVRPARGHADGRGINRRGQCSRSGAARVAHGMFLSGFAVAQHALDVAVPESIAGAIGDDPAPRPRRPRNSPATFSGPTAQSSRMGRTFLRRRLALKDSSAQRTGEALERSRRRPISDWHAVQLPDAAWPLYYPIRLIRLTGAYALGNRTPGDRVRDDWPRTLSRWSGLTTGWSSVARGSSASWASGASTSSNACCARGLEPFEVVTVRASVGAVGRGTASVQGRLRGW